MTSIADFSILAPVPPAHPQSGDAIGSTMGFVAFGSHKWESVRKVDELRRGAREPGLIYPSHEDVPANLSFVVSWLEWYAGCEESGTGKHSKGIAHRPPTIGQYTADNQGHCVVFWQVCYPNELPAGQRPPVSAIHTIKGGWRKTASPRGPEFVSKPSTEEFSLCA